jgi:Tfp pilus assembly protein PilF
MAYLATHHADLGRQNLEAALQKDPNFLYAASARQALATSAKRITP